MLTFKVGKGYSLIELLIVLLILGMAMSFGAPQLLNSLDNQEVKREKELLSDYMKRLPTKNFLSGKTFNIKCTNNVLHIASGDKFLVSHKFSKITLYPCEFPFPNNNITMDMLLTVEYKEREFIYNVSEQKWL